MTIRFDGRIAIVTGAGSGLGRAHAIGLAERGARVVVNDLGPGGDAVVAEIRANGGEAIPFRADVSDRAAVDAMVAQAMSLWGRIDILVNNAGLLRDRSFAKLDRADFDKVIDVHLNGTFNCTKAVWEIMRAQGYGRIVLTSSSSGLFGNFGQANYGAAKAAMVGLMNVLHLEGEKYGIRVNALAPAAATAMTDGLMPDEHAAVLSPEAITPGVLFLVSEDAPSRAIMGAGAGTFSRIVIRETVGVHLRADERTPEAVAANWDKISNIDGALDIPQAFAQTARFAERAIAAAAN